MKNVHSKRTHRWPTWTCFLLFLFFSFSIVFLSFFLYFFLSFCLSCILSCILSFITSFWILIWSQAYLTIHMYILLSIYRVAWVSASPEKKALHEFGHFRWRIAFFNASAQNNVLSVYLFGWCDDHVSILQKVVLYICKFPL